MCCVYEYTCAMYMSNVLQNLIKKTIDHDLTGMSTFRDCVISFDHEHSVQHFLIQSLFSVCLFEYNLLRIFII